MGRKYRIQNPTAIYFLTFTTVQWIDVFIRDRYREVIVDTLNFCRQEKGLVIYAWVIMTNHIHLIAGTGAEPLQGIVRDMKAYTSRKIRLMIDQENSEPRRTWILWLLQKAGNYNINNNDWQLWQQHNHPIELLGDRVMPRLNYLHNNPVKAGFVAEPHFWLWSSATDYAGGKGPVEVTILY